MIHETNAPRSITESLIAQSRAEGANLTEMLAAAELTEFEAWWATTGKNMCKITALAAWKARGARMSKCRGVAHPGCDYLAVCGHICNKCGQIA